MSLLSKTVRSGSFRRARARQAAQEAVAELAARRKPRLSRAAKALAPRRPQRFDAVGGSL